jgi:hypothetical protein
MNDMNNFIDKPKKFRKGHLELSRPPVHYQGMILRAFEGEGKVHYFLCEI